MSYDNAEPKILKTLNSSGQVLDDAGNVIGNSSDYWIRTYNQAEPKPDKILHLNGTIKDSAGNLIQNSTPFNIKKYNQAEPIPAKYLHADGTIDENSGGAGANLEDNKEVEITENGVVEITPSSGYDGMKKVTATVNVSGGGGDVPTDWYLWGDNENYLYYLPFETAPDTLDSLQAIYIGYSLIADIELSTREITDYFKYSDTKFGFTDESLRPSERSFTRVTEDIPLSSPVEPNKEVTITENGVEIIKPSQYKDFGYNSMAQVTVNVNVPSGVMSVNRMTHSNDIAKTVGTTGSVTVITEEPSIIGVITNGGINSDINGKIYLTDLVALGSGGSLVSVTSGPGALVIKLTATATGTTYTVTGEVVSVADTYFGGAVQLVWLG